jgi:3,4-dihydroxy 2-butanone 4-phosphate synthase/GTP cyclohydrolase II
MNIDKVINDIKLGIPVIVLDDDDRESEGDIVISAQRATMYNINFTLKYARGLLCMPCYGSLIDKYKIPMQSMKNSTFACAFSYGIDSIRAKTGVSVEDKLKTIEDFIDENSTENNFAYPGHLFPLRSKDGLLKERQGHTEASLELMRLSDEKPVSIICEIMNDDGSMATGQKLIDYSKTFNLELITVQEIYSFIYAK